MTKINTPADKHVSVGLNPKTARAADRIVERAWKEDLRVQGRTKTLRVKHSHVLRLAIEEGLPLVLDRLRAMQVEGGAEE